MAVENDSYCAETDVVGLVQMSGYTTSTVPTEAQLLDFQARRAATIYAWMVERVGSSAPGPASYSTTIDTGSDAGVALNALCIQTNAQGAAADALEAAGTSSEPARSERVTELLNEFWGAKESIQALVDVYVGASFANATHITEGTITKETVTSRQSGGFEFTEVTEW